MPAAPLTNPAQHVHAEELEGELKAEPAPRSELAPPLVAPLPGSWLRPPRELAPARGSWLPPGELRAPLEGSHTGVDGSWEEKPGELGELQAKK